MPEGQYYKDFINTAILTFTEQLVHNYLDKDGHDLSAVIRGRLYQLKDVVGIVAEFESYDKMKQELMVLENEGYTRTPEEMLPGISQVQ